MPGAPAPFVQAYVYDELNRLKSAEELAGATTTWKQVFSYDRYGNRGFAVGTTAPDYSQTPTDAATGLPVDPVRNPAFDLTNNRIRVTAAGQGDYRYDEAGNLLCEPGRLCTQGQTALTPYYAYDAENKMKTAAGGYDNGGTTYTYDGDGQRVKKAVSNGEVTVFVYDVMGRVVAEYSNQVQANGTSYLTQDHLGSTRAVTDKEGIVKSRHDYFPFGEEIQAGVGGRTTNQGYSQSDGVRQGFTGYEKDGETGLNFAQARYHSTTMGRFTSPDPLLESGDPGLPQSWNRYTYVLNNPLLFVDPTGLIWGYKDREDGMREFAWCAGDKTCEGYEPYTDYTYTFGDGRVVWFNQEEGTWGVDEPIRPDDSCLHCQGLIDEMARRGPAMEKMILTVTAVNLAPAAGIVGSGSLAGVGTQTLGLLPGTSAAVGGGYKWILLAPGNAVEFEFSDLSTRKGAHAASVLVNDKPDHAGRVEVISDPYQPMCQSTKENKEGQQR